ncbi:D-3-phosphoglycerate dehydrogenase (EC [Olavius algarvensis associated proteobacterium Delta 3]|nr:D-3-phosphoglycerate dehydrogenase (EC [Olavius algarvensis associated proteobacterium Delta 3]CAB5136201.1 D-3-phosphoglycerate dehydrogenase (EC [Olavius algarvensis associated proteobacterium Delta 3]
MTDIVISEFMDEKYIEETAKGYDCHYDPNLVDKPGELKVLLENARALVVRNRTQVNQELLIAAPKLKVVGRLGVGLDNIDLTACDKRGVVVCPATGANDASVAEWVITSLMILLRGAFLSTPQMLAGKWPREQSMGSETAGKTLGLIGFGRIARETASRAKALGMEVIAYDPYVSADDPCWQDTRKMDRLNELLPLADVVSLHVPLSEATHHLIDSEAISQMKPGSVLINAARGGTVDEKALVEALSSNHLGGAALDVFETEPLTESAAARFAGLPNVVLTPHIAGITAESNQRVSQVTMKNVCRVLEGST